MKEPTSNMDKFFFEVVSCEREASSIVAAFSVIKSRQKSREERVYTPS